MRRWAPLLVVLVAGGVGAIRAGASSSVPGDFLRYHRAGRLVVTGLAEKLYDERYLNGQHVYEAERVPGGDRLKESEFKYAPAFAVVMAPLGALPPRPASVLWGAWNAALIAAMFTVAWRWCARGLSAWWMLLPLALLARPISDNVVLGQLNPSAIVPATIGLAWIARGKDVAGGAAIGLGTVTKFLPGILAVWLAVRGKWRALGAWAGAVVLVGVVLPAVVLGPARSFAVTSAWIAARAHVYTSATPEDVPGFSMKSFVYRALGDTAYVTGGGKGTVVRFEAPHASLAPGTLQILVVAAGVLVLLAVVWFTRRQNRARDDPRGAVDASLWLAAIVLVSPEARFPHFLYLALPLVALTYALVRERAATARWRTSLVLSVAGALLLNATSEKLLGQELARYAEFYCAPGWAALAFAAALVILARGTPAGAAPQRL